MHWKNQFTFLQVSQIILSHMGTFSEACIFIYCMYLMTFVCFCIWDFSNVIQLCKV